MNFSIEFKFQGKIPPFRHPLNRGLSDLTKYQNIILRSCWKITETSPFSNALA